LPTVSFSNHTGYASWTGTKTTSAQLDDLWQGLVDNQLLSPVGHVLTGYVGSVQFLENIVSKLQHLLTQYPHVRYICDPVLGDGGQFYVPEECVPVYRESLLPLAHLVTPNQFELQVLTARTVASIHEAVRALRIVHSWGPPVVVCTSIEVNEQLIMVGSRRVSKQVSQQDDDYEVWSVAVPKLPGRFTGTGDLCAALLLAHTSGDYNFQHVLEYTMNAVYSVLEATPQTATSVHERELPIIACQDQIRNPSLRFRAVRYHEQLDDE